MEMNNLLSSRSLQTVIYPRNSQGQQGNRKERREREKNLTAEEADWIEEVKLQEH